MAGMGKDSRNRAARRERNRQTLIVVDDPHGNTSPASRERRMQEWYRDATIPDWLRDTVAAVFRPPAIPGMGHPVSEIGGLASRVPIEAKRIRDKSCNRQDLALLDLVRGSLEIRVGRDAAAWGRWQYLRVEITAQAVGLCFLSFREIGKEGPSHALARTLWERGARPVQSSEEHGLGQSLELAVWNLRRIYTERWEAAGRKVAAPAGVMLLPRAVERGIADRVVLHCPGGGLIGWVAVGTQQDLVELGLEEGGPDVAGLVRGAFMPSLTP
jgi:hypothetical protein